MPKVTITFNLPEESSEHKAAIRGADWKGIAYDIAFDLRNQLKYGHQFKTANEALEAIQTSLWDHCREAGLDPWED
jgi:hypothetical protein